MCICEKQSRSQNEGQGATNSAASEKKLTDAEIQIMQLVAPQIFEASYSIEKKQKKRRLTSFMSKLPSSKVTSPKLPDQKLPNQKVAN